AALSTPTWCRGLRVEVAGRGRHPGQPWRRLAWRLAPRYLPLHPWYGIRLARLQRTLPRGDVHLVGGRPYRCEQVRTGGGGSVANRRTNGQEKRDASLSQSRTAPLKPR